MGAQVILFAPHDSTMIHHIKIISTNPVQVAEVDPMHTGGLELQLRQALDSLAKQHVQPGAFTSMAIPSSPIATGASLGDGPVDLSLLLKLLVKIIETPERDGMKFRRLNLKSAKLRGLLQVRAARRLLHRLGFEETEEDEATTAISAVTSTAKTEGVVEGAAGVCANGGAGAGGAGSEEGAVGSATASATVPPSPSGPPARLLILGRAPGVIRHSADAAAAAYTCPLEVVDGAHLYVLRGVRDELQLLQGGQHPRQLQPLQQGGDAGGGGGGGGISCCICGKGDLFEDEYWKTGCFLTKARHARQAIHCQVCTDAFIICGDCYNSGAFATATNHACPDGGYSLTVRTPPGHTGYENQRHSTNGGWGSGGGGMGGGGFGSGSRPPPPPPGQNASSRY
jgi:hypothetical protein